MKKKFKRRNSWVAEVMFLMTKPKVVKNKKKYDRKKNKREFNDSLFHFIHLCY